MKREISTDQERLWDESYEDLEARMNVALSPWLEQWRAQLTPTELAGTAEDVAGALAGELNDQP